MIFKSNGNTDETIIVSEDISVTDNVVRSFILKSKNDIDGIKNIFGWFQQNYNRQKSLK